VRFIADLHVHSPYSRATSPASTLGGLCAWARAKGVHVVGTGDFTHPSWMGKMQSLLEQAEPGLYQLKEEPASDALPGLTPEGIPVRFLLTAEVSSIYKRGGRVRKVHNILLVPDLESALRINRRLGAVGNIHSDGRPILGLDSRDLLEILLEEAPEGFLVPAHIWTPWFSLFGSKSGFDSVEECFGDLSGYVFALETGLSSDPGMNRCISALDRFALISNSDCHSPRKLGREANLFDTELSFHAIRDALRDPCRGFEGTVEFYPEEGKYHLDGHRKCEISLEPAETGRMHCCCPACGRPVTVGVLNRVLELADRNAPDYPENTPPYHSLIPLDEVLSEIAGKGPGSKTVMARYARLVSEFGSEFNLLLQTPVDVLQSKGEHVLAEALDRMRRGQVQKQGGYDGQFGTVRLFDDRELREFGLPVPKAAERRQQAGQQ